MMALTAIFHANFPRQLKADPIFDCLSNLPMGYFQNAVKLILLYNPIAQLLILLEPFSLELHGINHVFGLCQLI